MVSSLIPRFQKITLISFLLVGTLSLSASADSQDPVRVLVSENVQYLSLQVKGRYKIVDPDSGDILSRGKNLKTTVTGYEKGIILDRENFFMNKIFLCVEADDEIVINGRRFRGKIKFLKDAKSKISVINFVDMEDYIKGILYHETSHYWPMEALKAQAIASRTFVVYKMEERKIHEFDVTSDIYSQVYGGKTSERYRTNNAVDQTKGKIIIYQGRAVPAFFHATCAGNTERASVLWSVDIPPLKGVKCGFCDQSPHFNWHYDLSLGQIKDKLVNSGYKIDQIKDIIILGRNNSGRIRDLKLVGDSSELIISAKDFRNIIGPNIIRSTNFDVNIVRQDAVFEGYGWGHGVGLCQWGAYFMAKNNATAEQILKYYYPKSEISLIR
ncbi:MAG: SpoIID/LytB domain-containing protein [Candidatus Omnitrophota bacterium]